MSVPEGVSRQPWQPRQNHHRVTRADLPAELTPETLRHLDLQTLRQLSRHGNGILDPEEQGRFDEAYTELLRDTNVLLDESVRRAGHGGPGILDPNLRRSYERTQQRLAAQAQRVRESLPPVSPKPVQPEPGPPDSVPTVDPGPALDPGPVRTTEPDTTAPDGSSDDDVSPDTLEQQLEQTSATLDMLEQIASLQQQQVEHQHRQLLGETRGLFFAFLVSVAVIIAGVAPVVEAPPHDRWLILGWTVVTIAAAGVVYTLVRSRQRKE